MPEAPPFPRALRTALAEALPGVTLARAEAIGEGWGAVAYRLPAGRGDDGGDWVLRLPRPSTPWAVDDLERESQMLPLLHQRPFEVEMPRDPVLLRNVAGQTIAAVHRWIPGASTKGLPLRGEARRQHLAGIGRFLSTLHTTPADLTRAHGVEVRDMWSEVSKPRIEASMSLAGPATRRWLASQVDAFESLDRRDVPSVLIHGDISPENLLADEQGRFCGVIDFSEARLSDAALDFAGVLHRFTLDDLQVVLDHYDAPVDRTLLARTQIYIAISPIYSVVDGGIALGAAERAVGLRRLAARARRATAEAAREAP